VKYPKESPTYLSLSILSCVSSWSDIVNYGWTEGTKEEIVDALCNETILKEIINFETKTFSEDQNGINLATEELNLVLKNIFV
jgi:hypothetical protein